MLLLLLLVMWMSVVKALLVWIPHMVSNFPFLLSHRMTISVSTHFEGGGGERKAKVPWNRVTGRQQILKKFHQNIIVINTKESHSFPVYVQKERGMLVRKIGCQNQEDCFQNPFSSNLSVQCVCACVCVCGKFFFLWKFLWLIHETNSEKYYRVCAGWGHPVTRTPHEPLKSHLSWE